MINFALTTPKRWVANTAIAAARGIADLKNTMLTLVESGLDSVCTGELGVFFFFGGSSRDK
jgi:hypothetical protein